MKKEVIIVIISILVTIIIIGIGIMIKNQKEEIRKEENIYENEDKQRDINSEINKLLENSDIHEYLPRDISEIKIIKYFTEDTKTDIYTDKEAILEFVKILSSTYWEKSDKKSEHSYVGIEIIGGDFTIKLDLDGVKNLDGSSEVRLTKGDLSIAFQISERIYYELYGYQKPKYYLHKSELEIPDKEKCYKAKEKALKGLNDNEIKKLQETIYDCQAMLEIELGECVHQLKEKTSYYWRPQIYAGEYTDPVTGTGMYTYKAWLSSIVQETREQIKIIKDEETKSDLEGFCNLLQEGLDERDIGKCFEAHEILHDYCVWVINYPVKDLPAEPYDWDAFRTYFGKASIIK